MSQSVYLSGWGSYHPAERLTNADLITQIDSSHEWLESRIGILERRKASAGETAAMMGTNAARAALDMAAIPPDELDLMVGATSYDDMQVPALSARIGNQLQTNAHAFDVRAACSGWLVGLDVARSFIQAGTSSRVLVTAVEHSDGWLEPGGRSGLTYFGDGAASAVVQLDRPETGLEVLSMHRASDNSLHHAVEVPSFGYFRTDAALTRSWVEPAVAKVAHQILDEAGCSVADLRAMVCHQANLRLIEQIASDMGVHPDKHWHNVEWAGNLASAGAPSALFEGIEANRSSLKDGDLILVVTVGAGLNVVGALLRWIAP